MGTDRAGKDGGSRCGGKLAFGGLLSARGQGSRNGTDRKAERGHPSRSLGLEDGSKDQMSSETTTTYGSYATWTKPCPDPTAILSLR